MKMKYAKIILSITALLALVSCKKFLDVVPDNVATIENAFSQRSSAEKYLFTCFSYMPKHGHHDNNPAFTAGDEIWYMYPSRDVSTNFWNIARGEQNSSDPLGDFWTGDKGGTKLYQGIRDCNIFLENIWKTKDMDEGEKNRWIAEVKFLKAYYHFYLLRMYGPIPVIKENLPISSSTEQMQVARDPVDTAFNYIVRLLDEAYKSEALPARVIGSEISDLGRITQAIVLSLKAKVLVYAASPLFNGNTDFASLKDDKGRRLFNQVYDPVKWDSAASACKTAIDFCEANGYMLHRFPPSQGPGWVIAPAIQTQLDIRAAVTEKFNNTEVIWPNTASRGKDIQRWAMPLLSSAFTSTSGPKGIMAPPLKMAELFYTRNGVPINEDKTWDYAGRFQLKKQTSAASDSLNKYYIALNEETVKLHYDREPRFYADLGFDRGLWFGNVVNNFNSNSMFMVKGRKAEYSAKQGHSNFSATGYYPKKLVSINTTCASDGNITSNYSEYPWPEIRLADLYLMYAEALNEANGPGAETYDYINRVRTRAGLNTVEYSWLNFSNDNTKYTTKAGLREIIQQERLIELAFEGHRFWDLRRWKKAHLVQNTTIKGWDLEQTDAPSYYKEIVLFNQTFQLRDYFWPIEIDQILRDRKLVQNVGW
jgi:hypothetical protein